MNSSSCFAGLIKAYYTIVPTSYQSRNKLIMRHAKPVVDIKAKQPESGHLCGNITEFGVVEGSPEPAG